MKVAIFLGSKSDSETMKKAADVLAEAEKVEKELEKKIEKTDESAKKASDYFNPHSFSNFWNGVTNGWDN